MDRAFLFAAILRGRAGAPKCPPLPAYHGIQDQTEIWKKRLMVRR